MPSPLCFINGVSPDGGVDVAAASTVTIQLYSLAGVENWTLECVDSDETTTPATITASLSINQLTRTATFTAPSLGRSMLFKSTVNDGMVDGQEDPDLSTTLLVCVRTLSNKRVLSSHERTEGSLTHGWVTTINSWLRGL